MVGRGEGRKGKQIVHVRWQDNENAVSSHEDIHTHKQHIQMTANKKEYSQERKHRLNIKIRRRPHTAKMNGERGQTGSDDSQKNALKKRLRRSQKLNHKKWQQIECKPTKDLEDSIRSEGVCPWFGSEFGIFRKCKRERRMSWFYLAFSDPMVSGRRIRYIKKIGKDEEKEPAVKMLWSSTDSPLNENCRSETLGIGSEENPETERQSEMANMWIWVCVQEENRWKQSESFVPTVRWKRKRMEPLATQTARQKGGVIDE